MVSMCQTPLSNDLVYFILSLSVIRLILTLSLPTVKLSQYIEAGASTLINPEHKIMSANHSGGGRKVEAVNVTPILCHQNMVS